ncbi:hypothetical protein [Desulfosporosinus acididurans]|uniref:hypothetical protein n=1 Tax=Desulfosporosinus acididurans TaxID=476652 RepID=UPI00064B53DF|nr:hypothetical protein [Desulfosporosinus acididurans]
MQTDPETKGYTSGLELKALGVVPLKLQSWVPVSLQRNGINVGGTAEHFRPSTLVEGFIYLIK